MTKLGPWKIGLVLAITMAVSYTICAMLYALWPARGIEFLNALFHGLDFRKLETSVPFSISTFFLPVRGSGHLGICGRDVVRVAAQPVSSRSCPPMTRRATSCQSARCIYPSLKHA